MNVAPWHLSRSQKFRNSSHEGRGAHSAGSDCDSALGDQVQSWAFFQGRVLT